MARLITGWLYGRSSSEESSESRSRNDRGPSGCVTGPLATGEAGNSVAGVGRLGINAGSVGLSLLVPIDKRRIGAEIGASRAGFEVVFDLLSEPTALLILLRQFCLALPPVFAVRLVALVTLDVSPTVLTNIAPLSGVFGVRGAVGKGMASLALGYPRIGLVGMYGMEDAWESTMRMSSRRYLESFQWSSSHPAMLSSLCGHFIDELRVSPKAVMLFAVDNKFGLLTLKVFDI